MDSQQEGDELTAAGQRDKFYGRIDKPFHRPECCCRQCLDWIKSHPLQIEHDNRTHPYASN